MYDSIDHLKQFFPEFLTKDRSNNFNKLLKVFNVGFRACRQKIDETYLLNKLYRPILVQRVQEQPYTCKHVVIVDIEDIKTIKVYKNNELIDTINFKYNDHVDEYTKEYTDTNESSIIVPDIYLAEVETYNEYKYVAGDEIYDKKLDILGKLINCKRLTFKSVEEEDYPYTYPTYNISKVEDDYSYLTRMTEYLSLLSGMPAPCLYLWKNYLVETKLVNCTHKIAKIGEYVAVPENKNIYLYNDVNTLSPLRDSLLKVNSYLYDIDFEKMTGDSAVYVKYDNEEDFKFKGLAPLDLFINNDTPFLLKSKYLTDGIIPVKDEVLVEHNYDIMSPVDYIVPNSNVTGADYYVSVNGDDNNDGLTRNTPFKTLQKALSMIKTKQTILLLNDVHTISETVQITKSCFIFGENVNNTIIKVTSNGELVIPPNYNIDINVGLLNITIQANKDYTYNKLHEYENKGDTIIKITGGV